MSIQPMGDFRSNKKWPEGPIEDWQQGASYGWIEEKYGRSYSTVAKLIRNAKALGVKRIVDTAGRKRQGGRTPLNDQKPLSYGHHSVGIRLNRFREIENVYTYQKLADMIDVNRLTVRKMELGLHDFTLGEIQKLAELMDVQVQELLRPFT
ncbi:helix-turn-helix domain-containing protein [Mesorhizobium sp. WSM2239]|uniref:Helix-turn-helix domain-containing protein n=2 Tax=unclassified Mesorhizobium TaxID=325217 RepID=A0AAU8D118_9HYPH